MAKNKMWTTTTKFEIILLMLKGKMKLNKICKRYTVAPSQVHAWKKQFLEQGSTVFNKSDKTSMTNSDHDRTQRMLYEKIVNYQWSAIF